jgi:hypothetical protein
MLFAERYVVNQKNPSSYPHAADFFPQYLLKNQNCEAVILVQRGLVN